MSQECCVSKTGENAVKSCMCKQKCEEERIVALVLYDDTVSGTEFECEKTYIIRTKLDEKRFREAIESARAPLNTTKDKWDCDDLWMYSAEQVHSKS